ncbi:MAG TPA: FMN-binding negative transcriptional regulator [Thermodesulfobacteriota bacterium]
MYVPEAFKEERVPVLHEAIRRAGLATLVSAGEGGLVATHLPLLLDPEPAPLGTLVGHVARANGHWRDLAAAPDALAVFLGPEGYVSPSWYPTKRETGKVVPTWNYVAVHAYGRVEVFDDPDRLLAVVTRLTDVHESYRADPWRVSDAPEDYVRAMLKGIVGVSLRIERIEGKWKMSQNRPQADREAVRAAFAADDRPGARAVAEVMDEIAREGPRR